jgi:hypothetical protein
LTKYLKEKKIGVAAGATSQDIIVNTVVLGAGLKPDLWAVGRGLKAGDVTEGSGAVDGSADSAADGSGFSMPAI